MKNTFLMVLMTMMAVGLTNCSWFGGDEGSESGEGEEQKTVAVYSVLPAPSPGHSKPNCLKAAEIQDLYNFTGDGVAACHSATAEACEKAKTDWTAAQTGGGAKCSSDNTDKDITAGTIAGEVRPCGTLKVETITCVKKVEKEGESEE